MWRSSSWPFSVFLSFKFVGPLSTCAQASTQIQYGTAKEQGLAYVISQTTPERGVMMRHGDHHLSLGFLQYWYLIPQSRGALNHRLQVACIRGSRTLCAPLPANMHS